MTVHDTATYYNNFEIQLTHLLLNMKLMKSETIPFSLIANILCEWLQNQLENLIPHTF